MENLSHTASKKICNGNVSNGFAAKKTVYDDVFAGPPRFGAPTFSPRVEDYDEIFGGFHASRGSLTIPVLDLPVVDETEVFFDVRSSKFDYSEVFGGFDGFDFAFFCEELFDNANGGDESSEEAWSPVETQSLSEKSATSAHSGKSQSLTNGDSFPSFDGIEQLNISYHEANERSKDDMPNGIHVTQAAIIPGFTFVVDEITPSQTTEERNAPSQVIDDIHLDMDFIERDIGGRNIRKTMSHPANNTGIHTFGKDINSLRSYSQNGSYHDEMFLTVAEISLRTHPSQLPPPSRPPPVRKVESGGLASDLKGTKNYAYEGIAGESSPPFFDVEVDASSSAAASAAAMKEAMEQAQAKLKSVKELRERKKDGLQSRAKLGSKSDIKDKKGNITKMVNGYNNLNDKRVCGTHGEDNGMNFLVGEERQKVTNTTLGVPFSVEGEEFFDVVEKSTEKRGKEFCSSLESYKTEAAGEWKEVNTFFELVKTDKSRNTIEQGQQASNGKIQVEITKAQGRLRKEKKIVMEASEQQEENTKKITVARAACELEENEKKLKALEETRMQEEHEKKVNVALELNKEKEDEKKFKAAYEHRETEKNMAAADVWNECDIVIKIQPENNYVEFEETMKQKENNQKLKVSNYRMVNENKLKEVRERKDNEKILKETFEREKYKKQHRQSFELVETEDRSKQDLENDEFEKMLKEVCEQEEIEKKQKEAYEREENARRLKEALEREENEKRLKGDFERNESEKKKKEAREREENEKKLKEAVERKENEKRLKEGLEKEANTRKQREAMEREEYEKRQKEALNREEVEKWMREANCKPEKNGSRFEEAQKRQESEKIIEEVNEQERDGERSRQYSTWEEGKKSTHDGVEEVKLKRLQEDHEGIVRDENEKKLKLVQGTRLPMETETLKASNGGSIIDGKNLQADERAFENEVNSVDLEATQEISVEEVSEKIITEPKDRESVVEAVEKASVPVDDRFEASCMVQGNLQAEEIQISRVDALRSVPLDQSVKKSGQSEIPTGQTGVLGNIKESQISFDPKYMETLTREWGERRKNIGQDQVAFNQELNKDKFRSIQMVNEGIQNGKQMGTAPSSMEGKRNTKRLTQHVNTSKSTERKGKNVNEDLKLEEREKEERMNRDKELEQDRLRKLEEEMEREREREKDRMAVERTTLEVRERAYAESRERAAVEKESAEARQRALVEARERLEKACADARERSLADKASMEARIRAERAAVERATAEARERAVEKAMVEKAAFEARERAERSACTSGSRYPYPPTYAGSGGKLVGVEGESAQRCKARLERHQRTTERAAKALAEKNTRDLLAQREQAERNRLAESLDADVKRWSSGKERNLRALLSTLQYVLGPDSGWQPVPLTDVITAAAVKKAYRKATLCVHPDKLQQRGASIRQKYICEKVFDLLKEAWNKFNSEER